MFVAELNEKSVPGVLFEEFVLDIADDAQENEETSTVKDGSYSNGDNGHYHEGCGSEKLSVAELEEAAVASAKPDKHFNLFKEATATNSCQVQYWYCIFWICQF